MPHHQCRQMQKVEDWCEDISCPFSDCDRLTLTCRTDEEDISPELKVEREKLRRQQNNARER